MKAAHPRIIFLLPVKVRKRRKWYLASCPDLDLHSQGETERRARENLAEAIFLFLESCVERKSLEQALSECGFVLGKPVSGTRAPDDCIEVPISLIAHAKKQAECRV